MVTDRPKCTGTNAKHGPCGADAQPGRAFCVWHDPDRAEERARWRKQGGRASSKRERAKREIAVASGRLSDLPGVLYRALHKVETGEIEPGVGTAMATIARAVVTCQQAHELEDRLAALEARAGVSRFPA